MDYLPPRLSEGVIRTLMHDLGLPAPTDVKPLQVTAEYHAIYILSFSQSDATAAGFSPSPASTTADVASSEAAAQEQKPGSPDNGSPGNGTVDLVLRVSGTHYPRIKTENEVAVMRWIRETTSIPIPKVIRYDVSSHNVLHHEFTLMERAPGVPLHSVIEDLSEPQLEDLMDQLVDVLVQLHNNPKQWSGVSGLCIDDKGNVAPGPVLEETAWAEPEVAKYWASTNETSETLNIKGPYGSYTEYVLAQFRVFKRAMSAHDGLAEERDLLPSLEVCINRLEREGDRIAGQINNTRYVLAHKDLHMANIMYDVDTSKITAVLDWEFAGVVPIQNWNPSNAFLWNGKRHASAKKEQQRMWEIFRRRCDERKLGGIVTETEYSSEMQSKTQGAVNFLAAIVRARVKGDGISPSWREGLTAYFQFLEDA